MKRLILIVLLSGAALFAIYSPSIKAPFFYDDIPLVRDNLLVGENSSFGAIFSSYFLDANRLIGGYRPITLSSLFIDTRIAGNRPPVHRSVNILIHLSNAFLIGYLIYLFLSLLPSDARLPNAYFAVAGAMIFLCHPLATYPINMVIKRSTLLYSTFYLLSLITYISGFRGSGGTNGQANSRVRGPMALILFFMMGLLCKEEMITLPLTIMLLSPILRGSLKKMRYDLPLFISLLVISALFHYFRNGMINIFNVVGHGIVAPSKSEYLAMQAIAVLKYINLFFLPTGLNIDHFAAGKDLSVRQIASAIVIFFLIFIALLKIIKGRKNEKLMGVGLLFYFIVLLPTSSFIPLVVFIDESRCYLALFGLLLFIICALIPISEIAQNKAHGSFKRGSLFVFLALILSLAYLTYARNKEYKDPLTVWEASVAQDPRNPRALDALGVALTDRGDFKSAEQYLKKAILVAPQFFSPYNSLGLLYIKMKRYEEGEIFLKKAESRASNYPVILNNLAFLYSNPEYFRPLLAIDYYEKLLRFWGFNPLYAYRMALTAYRAGLKDESIRYFRFLLDAMDKGKVLISQDEVIYLKSNTFYIMGNISRADKELKDARDYYERAITVKPDFTEAYINIAGVEVMMGDIEKGTGYYEKALKLDGKNLTALYNLGYIYERAKMPDKAREYYRMLTVIDPGNEEGRQGLNRLSRGK